MSQTQQAAVQRAGAEAVGTTDGGTTTPDAPPATQAVPTAPPTAPHGGASTGASRAVTDGQAAPRVPVRATGPLATQQGPYFGEFGGRFVPEALVAALDELDEQYHAALADPTFHAELSRLHRTYTGRPNPVTEVPRFAAHVGEGVRVLLKREDLNHTGSHKINNVLGQALLVKRMGKTRVIAETGAGQHGVATATAAALLDLECVVYMGEEDTRRQALNVARMRLLGAEVVAVQNGSRTLKDAINEALRDWVASVDTTHYLLGTVTGPHPFPEMVRDFHSVIGEEARAQVLDAVGRLPDAVLACVGGGSNAMGIFNAFLDDPEVRLFGFEAGGEGVTSGLHAARFSGGSPGVLQGTRSFVLQDEDGQTRASHSVSAGLDYPSVGPEHAWLHSIGRVDYRPVTDAEAMEAFRLLCRTEGIIPAIESAHALAGAVQVGREVAAARAADGATDETVLLVNLSGRGDKDVATAAAWFDLIDDEEPLHAGEGEQL
ncbi:tryptophan synthase subunit beta [Cellulomonas marina]|uniref:Tryptophan synthase beta chain n=1 Tax=Cellulomonas marina TaxID=988821 RepID=A0A1I0ZP89_9CELL|nr:tryptophan synthase subunit beta [Cellulomonas marina]GIG28871.1 tryptophan synthase beta chain [Cellulomonas marina]SFB27327.1 tryptophan synthase beta chain [Cellulomonas marina]